MLIRLINAIFGVEEHNELNDELDKLVEQIVREGCEHNGAFKHKLFFN